MLTELLIVLGLIVLNGILSMTEIALASSRKSKLELEAEDGNEGAKAALDLVNSPNKYLSTIQIGITVIGIITGVYGGASISENITVWLQQYTLTEPHAHSISLILVVLIITYFSLIFGELVPKRLGLHSPEGISATMAKPMNIISTITSPLIWILTVSTDLILSIFRIKAKEENVVSEEEIRALLTDAVEEGEVEKVEHDIVQRVFFLGDRNVASLMTHKMDLICLDVNDDFETNKKIISDSIHTNFPVYEGTSDNIIGVLNVKRLVPSVLQTGKFNIRSILNPPLFVPDTMNAYKLLEKLKESKTHIGIVMDQYGALEGAVTINDLFKALVGNLYAQNENKIIKREDGSWLADGLIPFDEFLEYYQITETLEMKRNNFHTLGGFVMYVANKIPVDGEIYNWKDYSFEIMDMDGMRIDKVLIRKKA
jgi:putative hemolysin